MKIRDIEIINESQEDPYTKFESWLQAQSPKYNRGLDKAIAQGLLQHYVKKSIMPAWDRVRQQAEESGADVSDWPLSAEYKDSLAYARDLDAAMDNIDEDWAAYGPMAPNDLMDIVSWLRQGRTQGWNGFIFMDTEPRERFEAEFDELVPKILLSANILPGDVAHLLQQLDPAEAGRSVRSAIDAR